MTPVPPQTAAASRMPAFESPRTILVNSVVAAVLGAGLMVLLHEVVHLVAGVALGGRSVLYPFGVTHASALGAEQRAIAALAAPAFSLVSGFALVAWQPLARRGGFGHLLWLWFAFTSIMEGVSYLVITPFGAGDTATAAELLGWPWGVVLAMCAVGVGLQFFAARLFAPHLRRHAGTDGARQWAFAFWPWLLASAVNVGLGQLWMALAGMDLTVGERIAITAAGLAVPVFAPMSFLFLRLAAEEPDQPLGLPRIPVGGLLAFAALTVLNLLLLRGFSLG